MTDKLALFLMTGLAFTPCVHAQTASDGDIRNILVERIDTVKQGVSIAVGVVDAKGRRLIAYGGRSGPPVNGDTVFEIGSVTKVFTSLLLADMVHRGEASLSDPVAKYLPAGTKVPERGGHSITLLDLATQTSGLPRLPSNLAPKDPRNPYADYSAERLYSFLAGYTLPRDIGSQYEYSNLGVGLLGFALARHAGLSYEALVRSRICEPLGMNDTRIVLTPRMQENLAPGHDEKLEAVANWDLPVLAGAGALRSTANDMLKLLAAFLGYEKTPLAAAMKAMLEVRRLTGTPDLEIALGWHIFKGDPEIVWHNGGTGGYRSFIGFSKQEGTGVVVLSNTNTVAGVDDIGLHRLDPKRPLLTLRHETHVDPKLLDNYTGRYRVSPDFILTVTREGNHLFTQASGQPRFEIFARGQHVFFPKAFDAELTFEVNSSAKATKVVLYQGGRDTPAERIGDALPPVTRTAIKLDPNVLEAYTGTFQVAPAFALTVTHADGRLYVQATGQDKFEVFAESQHDFFVKIIDAQLTFKVGDDGRAATLVLHQNGANLEGRRVP